MPRAHKREEQPWLRYLVLPLVLILFGLFVSYAILAQQKQKEPTTPVPTPTNTPNPTPTPTPPKFVCPTTPWVDCMPGPDRPRSYQCSAEFLRWATENCPGFQGTAY